MNNNKKPIVEVENLNFSYNKNNIILDNVSFKIFKGELVAIIGPNGTGKSTLVKILSGLINTKDVKNSVKINSKISYIPQKSNTDNNFPAKVNELLNLECCNCSVRDEVLKSLNIDTLQEKQFKTLSGGQQQRVLIAMSLLSEPNILILDEPTVGVDKKTLEEFYKLLKKLNKERNLTILFVTHDISMLSNYFDKTIHIHNKKVCIEDSSELDKSLNDTYPKSFHKIIHNHNHNH